MNEDAVRLWIRRAESDLKTGKDELATDQSLEHEASNRRPLTDICLILT